MVGTSIGGSIPNASNNSQFYPPRNPMARQMQYNDPKYKYPNVSPAQLNTPSSHSKTNQVLINSSQYNKPTPINNSINKEWINLHLPNTQDPPTVLPNNLTSAIPKTRARSSSPNRYNVNLNNTIHTSSNKHDALKKSNSNTSIPQSFLIKKEEEFIKTRSRSQTPPNLRHDPCPLTKKQWMALLAPLSKIDESKAPKNPSVRFASVPIPEHEHIKLPRTPRRSATPVTDYGAIDNEPLSPRISDLLLPNNTTSTTNSFPPSHHLHSILCAPVNGASKHIPPYERNVEKSWILSNQTAPKPDITKLQEITNLNMTSKIPNTSAYDSILATRRNSPPPPQPPPPQAITKTTIESFIKSSNTKNIPNHDPYPQNFNNSTNSTSIQPIFTNTIAQTNRLTSLSEPKAATPTQRHTPISTSEHKSIGPSIRYRTLEPNIIPFDSSSSVNSITSISSPPSTLPPLHAPNYLSDTPSPHHSTRALEQPTKEEIPSNITNHPVAEIPRLVQPIYDVPKLNIPHQIVNENVTITPRGFNLSKPEWEDNKQSLSLDCNNVVEKEFIQEMSKCPTTITNLEHVQDTTSQSHIITETSVSEERGIEGNNYTSEVISSSAQPQDQPTTIKREITELTEVINITTNLTDRLHKETNARTTAEWRTLQCLLEWEDSNRQTIMTGYREGLDSYAKALYDGLRAVEKSQLTTTIPTNTIASNTQPTLLNTLSTHYVPTIAVTLCVIIVSTLLTL